MTDAAQRFVGPATFAALSGRAVVTTMWQSERYPLGPHIELAKQADLLCIAPMTANMLAKAAHGIADDLISTLLLSFTGPVLLAPAMNCEMWTKPAVQRNVVQCQADGYRVIGPESGWLSCRDQGAGRMVEPETLLAAIETALG
jgi:phosphopantothenoylcysteine decarboxylase/phosphopantothenate--cysteine ligase